MSATTTIHRSTQLFTLDCPRRSGDVGIGPDATTDNGHETVHPSDAVSIPDVALGQPIHTHVITSADPHAIRSPGVHPLAI